VRAVQRNLHHRLLRSGVLIAGSSRAGTTNDARDPPSGHSRRAGEATPARPGLSSAQPRGVFGGSLPLRLRASPHNRALACGPRGGRRRASTAMAGLPARPWPRPMPRALAARASALVAWRSTTRSPRGRHPSTAAGLEDQRRRFLGALDADPGAEQPAARAVATLLVRCQPEALAHHASTLAAAQRTVNRNPTTRCTRSGARGRGRPTGMRHSPCLQVQAPNDMTCRSLRHYLGHAQEHPAHVADFSMRR
jgi:hypothetical protein